MSFPALLIIWLAVLVVAYAGGWVAHIMDRRPGNLSGVSYQALHWISPRRHGAANRTAETSLLGSRRVERVRMPAQVYLRKAAVRVT